MEKAMEMGDSLPIGVIYKEIKPTFHEKNEVLSRGESLIDIETDSEVINKLIHEFV